MTPYPLRKFLFITLAVASLMVGLTTGAHGITHNRRGQQIERTAAADAHVTVSACTLSGSFTVRSWNRNEVRVRISDNVDIELARTDQNPSGPARELRIVSKGRRSNAGNSCLMVGDVEMDVPRGANVKLQTTSGDIDITDIARADVVTTSGSMTLKKISEQTNATVIGGDLAVSDSTGSFKLHSTGGTIEAQNLSAATATDSISATTVGGEVTLNHIQHQRVSANAVSGDVIYSGALMANGSYSFQSLSGDVRLALPANSSFRLSGTLGESVTIRSDFNLNYTENQNSNHGAPRRVAATVGNGSASLRIQLMTGVLRITKQ